jgi:YfiH family protein
MPVSGTRKRPRRPARSDVSVLRAATFEDLSWLRHGFSTRVGGVSDAYGGHALNLGFTQEDTHEHVERNRELFFGAIGCPPLALGSRRPKAGSREPWPSVAMRQIHSSMVHHVEHAPEHPLAGDGLITRAPRLVLSVRTADCVPVLIADPVQRAAGAFHAGWRGTLARIVEKGVGEMRRWFGSDPADLRAAIGPAIHRCCYEVSDELRDQFTSQFAYAGELFEDVFASDPVRERYPLLFLNQRAPGHGEPPRRAHLDLIAANRRQLLDAGLRPENIWASELCTSCRTDLLFSHRREKGVTGRMMAAIAVAGS